MKRGWIVIVVVACPLIGLAEQGPPSTASRGDTTPYQPAVPPPSMMGAYGGWPAYGGASTAAGSALNGMSSVISAKGNYNLSTSAAAVNLTQAQSAEIQNRDHATHTYFEMRATNKAAREAEIGPRITMEQIEKNAHAGVPKPLATSQMDPVTGKIAWPSVLQEEDFAPHRAKLDQLIAKEANYGGLSYSDQSEVRDTINAMFRELKAEIKKIPPPDYIASRTFLNSLLYSTTKSRL